MFSLIIALIASVGISAGVSGGGGGGGGSSSAVSTTSGSSDSGGVDGYTTSDAEYYRTTEYESQWGLESIHAAEAYAYLAANDKTQSGSGVKVGIVDSGIQSSHDEIDGNLVSSGNKNYSGLFDSGYSSSDISDGNGHGTHVASTAAGVRDGSGMHGVAYNSKIIVSKVLDSSGSGYTYYTYLGVKNVIDNGAEVVNLSLGSSSSDTYNEDAVQYAKSNDVLIAAATGNSGSSQPLYPAYYASDSTYAGYILAVGAVDSSDSIASFSNDCGDAMDYCLVAPGVDIYAAMPIGSTIDSSDCDGSGYCSISGTSMATPHVTGAAAVIRAAWPLLTAPEVAQILLDTATDLGDTGIDSVYGHGMLNLYEAVQAQGESTLSSGTSLSSSGYTVEQTSISSDPIFGDVFTRNVASELENVVFFDKYGRDYKANLSSKITSKSSYTVPTLDSIAFNNYNSRTIPVAFGANGSSKLQLQLRSYNVTVIGNLQLLQLTMV